LCVFSLQNNVTLTIFIVAKGPGLFFVLPCIDTIVTVDLRTITFDVPSQEILTKDSVTVTVDAVCYYRTVDPVMTVTNVENAEFSTRLLSATTLRNILGTSTLQEILQDKEKLARHMQVSKNLINSYF
jgi:erythrocyte band 7 integral membrane protein